MTEEKPDRRKNRGVEEWPPGSGRFRIDYYDAEGRRHREMIGSEKLAVNVYRQRRTEIWEGRFRPKDRSKLKFRELAERRMAAKKTRLSPRSYKTDADRLKTILADFGDLPARSVSSSRIESFLERVIDRGASKSTANRYRSLISSIFSHGIRDGSVDKNPVKRVERYREPKGRVRFLDAEEEAALRGAIVAQSEAHVWEFDLALHTGMRRGEQWALEWADIDPNNGVAHVDGKTGARQVRLNDRASEAIRRLHESSNGSSFVSPDRRRRGQADFRRWFERACEKAGVDGVSWHTLRHTFCSRLAMAGVDLVTIRNLAGHTSIQTTMRYAHLSPGHEEAAVGKLDTFTDTPRRKRFADGQQALGFQ